MSVMLTKEQLIQCYNNLGEDELFIVGYSDTRSVSGTRENFEITTTIVHPSEIDTGPEEITIHHRGKIPKKEYDSNNENYSPQDNYVQNTGKINQFNCNGNDNNISNKSTIGNTIITLLMLCLAMLIYIAFCK